MATIPPIKMEKINSSKLFIIKATGKISLDYFIIYIGEICGIISIV